MPSGVQRPLCTVCNSTWKDGPPAAVAVPTEGVWDDTSAEVIVAHCSSQLASAGSSLEWVPAAVASINATTVLHVARVIIYSKCGAPQNTSELPVALRLAAPTVEVRILPNVGRNDMTYAHHLANEYHQLPAVSFLMKGRTAAGRTAMKSEAASMATMAIAVTRSLFTCGFKTGFADQQPTAVSSFSLAEPLSSYKISTYRTKHSTHRHFNPAKDLGNACAAWDEEPVDSWRGYRSGDCSAFFNMTARPHVPGLDANASKCRVCFKSALRPLAPWVNHSTVFSPAQARALWASPIWRMCFGGSFATNRRGVRAWPRAMWQRLSDALARADSIEEGHYVERLWGRLLSPPLDAGDARALACAGEGTGSNGLLVNCNCGGWHSRNARTNWALWGSAAMLRRNCSA